MVWGLTTIEKIHPHFVGFSIAKIDRSYKRSSFGYSVCCLENLPTQSAPLCAIREEMSAGYQEYSMFRIVFRYYRE